MAHLELSFVTEHSLGSWIIRQGTHSDYSHVDIIADGYRIGARTDHGVPNPDYYKPYGPFRIVQPTLTGVQARPMDYSKFARDDRLIIPVDRNGYDASLVWLRQQIGKPYDKTGLLRSFVLNLPQSDTPWWDEAAWWCSELATVFVHMAGFPACRTPCNRMSPNDCYIYAGCFAT